MARTKKLMMSFVFALRGIAAAFRSQFNLRFHFFSAALVIVFAFYFKLEAIEWVVILLCIGSVLGAELINSSIEYQVDLISPEPNEKAGKIKDIAAAAVLIVALMSAIIGLIIFIPKIQELFQN